MSEQEFTPPTDVSAGYDTAEPKAKLIAIFGVAAIIFLVLVLVSVQSYYDYAHDELVYQEVLKPIGPDLQGLHAREDALLGAYKFADREKGVVRLPIARAMELVAKDSADGKPQYPTKPYVPKPDTPAAGATAVPAAAVKK